MSKCEFFVGRRADKAVRRAGRVIVTRDGEEIVKGPRGGKAERLAARAVQQRVNKTNDRAW